MAKPLVFQLEGKDVALEISKVSRDDLYGYIETEALDSQGRRCSTATLADDGQTLIGSGGSAFASLSPDGMWLEKSSLTPVDVAGNRITPVASSFSAPIALTKTATIDEYLSCNIRGVYQLSGDLADLLPKLKSGTIYTFPYSYRGGLEPDTAFLLLAADGTPFLAIGTPTKLEFIGLDQPPAVEEDAAGEESEEIDFGMM